MSLYFSTGYGVWDTLLKEAEEEASIPEEIMSRAKPVGAISYTIVNDYGTAPEVEFVYDLELPLDFVPKNADGEVAGTFTLNCFTFNFLC